MHDEGREKVLGLLTDYPRLEKEITLLRYQLDHPPVINENEMIESMNFSHGDGQMGAANPGVSNKTQSIALNYQATLTRENEELRKGLRLTLYALESERDELLRRIDLLESDQASVLRRYYIEGKRWNEIAVSINVSVRTAQRIREKAVSELCEIYKAL